jgi:polyhydroxyalkanoate synthesis regulator phasin
VQPLRTRLIVIAGAAAIAGLSASLFLAVPGQLSAQPDVLAAPKPGDKSKPGNAEARKQQQEQMHARVAANLGITPERLTEAFAQARKDLVQDLVQQGKLTQEEADKRIARITQGPKPDKGDGQAKPGKPAKDGQPGARIPGPQVKAFGGVVAQALGLAPKELRDAINAGKTIEQLAVEKGITSEQLRTLIGQQLEQRLTAALQSGSLNEEQAAQIRARHQLMIDSLLSGQPRRGPGRDKPAQS